MEPNNYDVRLVGGASDYFGRLEIYFNGVWGSVCMDGFTDTAAQIVCRQLGYEGGTAVSFMHMQLGGFVWLDDVMCSGGERNLGECEHSPWGVHNCMPGISDISVQCEGEGGEGGREGGKESQLNASKLFTILILFCCFYSASF